jgi:DNA-binding LacI/PurR family transcriptional regulator
VRAPAAGGNLSRPPVMADVARLAGVSHQTVSRVLNEHPNVRPLTRERVLAAIRELAYRPNAAARTLVTRRTHTLGVITADTMLYGPTSMLYGFERAAAHDAYFVSVASLPALDRRSMLDAVERFLGQGIEGIIVIATVDTAVAALGHVPPEVPLVAVGCGTRASVTSVAIDNAAGAAAATRYLLGLGHKTVYHLAGPLSCLDAKERVDGWRQALREAGADEPAVLAGDWSASSGYELGGQLAADSGLTAVFCGNDTMALGVIRALTERGLRVPGDVSVVGFDDVPEAGYYLPPLSTVRQDFGELGRHALSTLIDRMSGAIPAGRRVRVAPELIVRASAAPPQ